MALNTLKTTLGFFRTLIEKYTPLQPRAESLANIYNYLPINDSLCTSGQPTERQFALIEAAGYQHVINLAPHNAENSLADEAGVLSRLGIDYIHIPVDFKAPSEENFQHFANSLQALTAKKVWVHCAANMRVSAFIYRYRCQILGEQSAVAEQALSKVWQPFGVWKTFLSTTEVS